jgi:hypothetical protein
MGEWMAPVTTNWPWAAKNGWEGEDPWKSYLVLYDSKDSNVKELWILDFVAITNAASLEPNSNTYLLYTIRAIFSVS